MPETRAVSENRHQKFGRRFPPPWTVEELDACYVVRDHDGQQLAYIYFEDEPGRRSATKLHQGRGAPDRGEHCQADDLLRHHRRRCRRHNETTMSHDPFLEFRKPQAAFDSVTAADGRGLTLRAIDLAAFHPVADAVIALASKCGWRVTRMRRHGPNIELLTIASHR